MAEEVKTNNLASMLGTDDEQQQVAIVSKLLEVAQAQPLIMTAVFDPRSGDVALLLNGTYSFAEIYTFIDLIRKEVQRREVEAIVDSQKNK